MIHHAVRPCSLLIVIILVMSLGAAAAQQTAAPSDDQVAERLAALEQALYSAQPRAKTWWYGWLGAYSAGTAVQLGLAAGQWKHDRKFAEDMLVGGATTLLGVGALLIDPFLPAYAPNRLRSMPEGTAEERRAKLGRAEEILRQCALREKAGRGWTTHLLNLGANAAAGIVYAAAFKRPWTDGLLTFAAGEAVSLANIFTQPCRAVRDWRNYEVRYLGKPSDGEPSAPDRHWSFSLFPGGISLGLSW